MTKLTGVWCMRRDGLDPAYLELAPSILWPDRPALAEAIEVACGWFRSDAAWAAAALQRSAWGDGTTAGLADRPDRPIRRSSGDPGEALRAFEQRVEAHRARFANALEPAEAWARLAPGPWRDAADRWFFGPTLDGPAPDGVAIVRTAWGIKSLHRAPLGLSEVIALAADPEGVVEAEALGREVAARLAPWGAPRATRVLWHVDVAPVPMNYRGSPPIRARLTKALGVSPELLRHGDVELSMRHVPVDSWRFDWQRLARQDVLRAGAFRRAAALGEVVPALEGPDGVEACGRSFASLPDPHEPLLRIWELGYAFEAIADGALILAASAPSIHRAAWD